VKLYVFPVAPNPTKLRSYVAEKEIAIEQVMVDLREKAQKRPEFLAKNPVGRLPVLELDDGECISESLAIIEYLEELHPEPPMIGRTAVERALTRRIERICELGVMSRVARIVHNTNSPLPERKPNPPVAEQARQELPAILRVLEAEIGERPFLAGERPSIADCTLFGIWEFGRAFGIEPDPELERLHRWHAAFRERPSASWNPDPHAE
jgi:glutathione S-transferase